jgi:glycine cleavage system protein P-like pyridoxal-binding family
MNSLAWSQPWLFSIPSGGGAPAVSPTAFTVCPVAFVSAWTPEECRERQRLYEAALQKAQRAMAFLPDERRAFP